MSLPTPYYDQEGIVIYCGDQRDLLPELAPNLIDLVIADPPYGVNTKSDGMGKLSPWADLCNASLWYEQWLAQTRRLLMQNGAVWSFLNWRSLVTYQKAACDLGWPIESLLVWDKEWIGPGGPYGLRPSYELVALWRMPEFSITDRGIYDIQTFPWSGDKPNGHPAEKPQALAAWLIEICLAQYILDPFMGSGTTLRAAKDLGRKAIGIEIEEKYCEIAVRRLAQEVLPL
jgi:site-specific DNA-methyltransferase (adenine-specific)